MGYVKTTWNNDIWGNKLKSLLDANSEMIQEDKIKKVNDIKNVIKYMNTDEITNFICGLITQIEYKDLEIGKNIDKIKTFDAILNIMINSDYISDGDED